jgi:hypothetical protein
VEQSQAIRAQIVSPNPEPLEFMLNLVRSRVAAYRLLRIRILTIAVAMTIAERFWLPVLAHGAHFAPRFQPHEIELCNASARLRTLASHV